MVERRNLILAVILVAVIGGSAIGIYLYSPTTVRDTFVEATIGEPQYLDPGIDYETSGGGIIQQTCETLIAYNGTSAKDVRPWLAESYTVSSDGKTYTFVLRQGIKYHDGSTFNAYTMKWSLDRCVLINDPDGPSWMLAMCIKGGWDYYTSDSWGVADPATGAWTIAPSRSGQYAAAKAYLDAGGIEVVSDYVMRINVDYMNTGEAYPPFLLILANSWGSAISPTAVLAHGGSDADDPTNSDPSAMSVANYYKIQPTLLNCMGVVPGYHNTWMETHVVGTGPFTLVEWTPAQRIALERFDSYWGGPDGTGPAKLRRVIIERIDEFDTRKLRLLTGQADYAWWPSIYADQIIDVTTRTVLPEYAGDISVVLDKPTLQIDAAGLNMNVTLDDVTATKNKNSTLGTHENPLQYREFRQALQYCFNHATFIDALNGFGTEPNSPIVQGLFGYDANIPVYEYNYTKAAAMFASVGWEGSITIYYNSGNDVRKRACLILKDGVGNATNKVSITVQELAWPDFLFKIQNKESPVFFVGWLADYADADNFIMTYAYSSGTFTRRIGYSNDTVDALLDAAAIETDAVKRQADYTEVSTELYRQAVYIYLQQPLNFHLQRSWVNGFIYNPLYSDLMGLYYNIWKT